MCQRVYASLPAGELRYRMPGLFAKSFGNQVLGGGSVPLRTIYRQQVLHKTVILLILNYVRTVFREDLGCQLMRLIEDFGYFKPLLQAFLLG